MRNHAEFSDEELLKMLQESASTAAFEEIYTRYWDKLHSAAYKRLRSAEAAEEIVQEVFTKIWIRRQEICINLSLPVYLFTAVKYKVLNHLHHESVKSHYSENVKLTIHDFDNSTEETVMLSDLNRQLKLQVELLPVKCREVFELSRNEHKSNREIAWCMGISEKTVENHISKALRRLRISLNSFLMFF